MRVMFRTVWYCQSTIPKRICHFELLYKSIGGSNHPVISLMWISERRLLLEYRWQPSYAWSTKSFSVYKKYCDVGHIGANPFYLECASCCACSIVLPINHPQKPLSLWATVPKHWWVESPNHILDVSSRKETAVRIWIATLLWLVHRVIYRMRKI